MSIFADSPAPYRYEEIHLRDRLQSPSAAYPLGTDHVRRDLLSRLIHGARLSLTVGPWLTEAPFECHERPMGDEIGSTPATEDTYGAIAYRERINIPPSDMQGAGDAACDTSVVLLSGCGGMMPASEFKPVTLETSPDAAPARQPRWRVRHG